MGWSCIRIEGKKITWAFGWEMQVRGKGKAKSASEAYKLLAEAIKEKCDDWV
jgi:hypothetical protein